MYRNAEKDYPNLCFPINVLLNIIYYIINPGISLTKINILNLLTLEFQSFAYYSNKYFANY